MNFLRNRTCIQIHKGLTDQFEKCLKVFSIYFSNIPANYKIILNEMLVIGEVGYKNVTANTN